MSSSSSRTFAQHVRVSSTDELSYDASSRGEINETIHTIVTGRKCWKTMKGKGEVVWPPFLELALVEGLEKYQPVESRTTRAFGRFPMRNKFISDYIFNKTGKRRTPKQVGSRLQQLRDTTEGKRILQQLSSRHIAMMQPKSEPVPDPSNPTDAAAPAGPPVSYLTIDILPDTPGSGYPSPALSPLAGPSTTGPQAPRPMRAIDPTVTFISRSALQAYASVRVVRDGRTVWLEKTALSFRDSNVLPARVYPAQMECQLLYSTEVVPGFWGQLCEYGDPTPFAIYQDIVRLNGTDAATAIAQPGTPPPEDVLLSIVYRFKMHSSSSPPLSPSTSSVDALSYSHESSPEIGSDYGELLPSLPMIYTPSSHSSQLHSHSPHHLSAHTPSPRHPQTHSLPPLHHLPHIPSPPASVHAHSPSQMSLHHSGSLPQIRAPTGSPATPGLIHRHEEGYASLPPSPLDLTFPAGVQHHPAHTTTLPSLASLQSVPPMGGGMCGGAGYAAGYGQATVYDGMAYTFDPSNTYAGL